MQVVSLPVLRDQPFFNNAMFPRIATNLAPLAAHMAVAGPTRCSIDRCDHFAKLNGMCLTHHRTKHVRPAQRSPVATSSASSCCSSSHGDDTTTAQSPSTPTDAKLKLKNRNRKCRTDACLSYARSGGYCTRHGGGRKCKVDNCGTASQTGGYCRLHGGGSRCRITDCNQFARIRGLCLAHNRGTSDDATTPAAYFDVVDRA
ncbi:Aste57867_21201 [Aphanomyces stellatus]|uniref:Aste57867_21201 protein n=1 Tax=Aphanomyces stellatus TaxID=120398 RepID=A0A485LHI2_9STRA|nr:hypothetical protein As57867_021133 [Aphanomyces stellatus]VFT97874.1 Aste57867_21201 [Aphanomyces stellatus]